MTTAQWAVLGTVAFVNIAVVFLMWRANRDLRRRIVFDNLGAAAAGGSFEPGGYLYGCSPDEIAYDLTLYAADCEQFRSVELTPHVRDWLQVYHVVRVCTGKS